MKEAFSCDKAVNETQRLMQALGDAGELYLANRTRRALDLLMFVANELDAMAAGEEEAPDTDALPTLGD